MDHGNHGAHGGGGMDHGGGDGIEMPMKCSMNMLWNSNVADTCVVFEQWHISTWWGMVVSCSTIILISLFYSHLLYSIKRYDRRAAVSIFLAQTPGASVSASSGASEETGHGLGLANGLVNGNGRQSPGPGAGGSKAGVTKLPKHIRLQRAGLYALSVTISFFLMLVAMTYNSYLFASIILGAFVGHLLYEDEMDIGSVLSGTQSKGLACH